MLPSKMEAISEPRLIWDIIEKILGNLRSVDLKVARLVCRQWNDFIKRGVLYLDWEPSDGKDPVQKFLKTLTNQNLKPGDVRCKSLRIKNGISLQFKLLLNDLTPSLLLSTFGNIRTVELKGCIIPLSLFFKFLSEGFPSIKILCLFDTTFSGHHDLDEGTLKSCPLPALDKLRIHQKNGDAGIDSFLKGLSICLPSVEEFEFNIGVRGCKIYPSDLKSFLHKSADSLGILRLNWEYSTQNSLGNAMGMALPIFEWPHASTPLITQLHLSFAQITMKDSHFIMTLILFLLRCDHLKRFSLGTLMNPQIICQFPKDVEYTQEYGVLATNDLDWWGHSSAFMHRAKEVRNTMSDPGLQTCLSRLWVEPIFVPELRNLLPIREAEIPKSKFKVADKPGSKLNFHEELDELISSFRRLQIIKRSKLIFDGCRELSILIDSYQGNPCKTHANFTPTLTSFNVRDFVSSFPGLTTLTIIDGPEFNYKPYGRARRPGKEQWAEMSKASIGDKDFQLILGGLLSLKSIKICANMRNLTDFGLTGRRVTQNQGVPISSLRGIEEVVLKGLGPGVTDVSCQFAFKGCQELYKVTLFGDTRFTAMAKSKLRRSLKVPLPDACKIQLI